MLTLNFILMYLGGCSLAAPLFVFGARQTKSHPALSRGMVTGSIVIMAMMLVVMITKIPISS